MLKHNSCLISPQKQVTMSTSVTLLSDLCSLHSLPQPLYDLEAVASSFTMCCIVGRFKETSSDYDKSEAKRNAAAKVYSKLRNYLENKEDLPDGLDITIVYPDPHQMTWLNGAPSWLIKPGRRPSIEELTREQSLEELCSTTGLARPVYDMEAVGNQVTMCCIAGMVKQTASGGDKQEAKRKAAGKVMEKLIRHFQEEEAVASRN